eukprot:s569_g33.t1
MGDLDGDQASDAILQKIATYFDSVIAERNFGEFVNETDRTTLDQVLQALIGSPSPTEQRPTLNLIPNESLKEFWLPLVAFDVSARSKSGYFPQNVQIAAHFREFLKDGYRVGAEAIETKFAKGDSTRQILSGSVGISDGFCKVLIMYGICLICHHLELTQEQLELPGVQKVLKSFRLIRCAFTYYENPSHYYLHALRIQHVSAQKQAPSPLDFLGNLKEAVGVERRLSRAGASSALKDVVGRCVSEYNKMVTKKAHRIDTEIKKMILNLLRTDDEVQQKIHSHYDLYPHSVSALPMDVLQQDWWVPGSTSRAECARFQGKDQFREILAPNIETTKLWVERATQDFQRRVGPDASVKTKKNAQLDDEGQLALHDICCLWHWLVPKMQHVFPTPVVEKHQSLFMRGALDTDLCGIMRAGQEFTWDRIPFILEVKGESVDEFICQAQDRTRNAHSKSLAAAWNVWHEMLRADQIAFESDRIASDKEQAKRRGKLVAQLEEMHHKAWDVVSSYIKTNLTFCSGRSIDAESTILPEVTGWVRDTLSDIPEVRQVDDHCVIAFANLTTVGVMPGAKYDWFLTSLSNLLANNKRNSIGIIVHCNRASDTGRKSSGAKKEKVEKDEDDNDKVAKDEESDNDEEEEGQDVENPEEADIRDMRFKLEKALAASSRNLVVKNLTWVFDKATVYGKRDACVHGLAVLHRDRLNLFKSSDGWKHAVIRDCCMLSRAQMYKPEAATSTPHLGRAFTWAQEMRQVAGGCDIIRKTLSAFVPDSVQTCLMLDLHCYDCWPALAALEECAEKRRVLCASVVLDREPEALVQRLSNKVYEMCRSNALTLVGFPVFGPVVAAIQEAKVETPSTQFQVTVKKHDRLVILQSLAEKWMSTEFKDATVQEVETHNAKYNQGGEYWHQEEQRNTDDGGRPMKRIKLEESEVATEADVVNLQKPHTYQINNCAELVCGQEGSPLYLVSRNKNQFIVGRELFSFGSGDWRAGQDGVEVMSSDSCGRWFSFSIDSETLILLEKKNLPDHVASLPCVNTPVPVKTVLRELEDSGEVKLAVTNHKIAGETLECTKPLAFLMDPPKDREEGGKPAKKKQKKASGLTDKNYGSIIDIAQFKKAKRLTLAWRCRLDANNSTGTMTLVPIRPIACLNGTLDLGTTVMKLF